MHKEHHKKTVIYYTNDFDNAQFRYRCYNIERATKNSKKWQVACYDKNHLKELKNNIINSHIFVIERQSLRDNTIKNLVKIAQNNHIPVLLDIDDLVFDLKFINVVMKTIGAKNYLYWLFYVNSIQRIARRVDGFIATNDFLGQKLFASFNKPYQVIPNSLNQEQLKISAICCQEKAKRLKNNKTFRIGYFSGSPTHVNDFKVVEPEIIKLLREHSDMQFNIVGYMKFDKEMQHFIKNGQIKFLPPVDFRKLQRLMSEVDVNIAPLVENDFTNCKSELKFFEAAAVETTTIATPTYAFKNAIKHGETGFLCQPGEWYDTILDLYKHPAKNRKIALAAKDYCLKQYYGPQFLKEVEKAYDYFAK